jgi:hypothetical protein
MITGMAPNFENETFRIEKHHNERRVRLCKMREKGETEHHYVTNLLSISIPAGMIPFHGRAKVVQCPTKGYSKRGGIYLGDLQKTTGRVSGRNP